MESCEIILDLSNKDYAEAIEHYLNGRWMKAKRALEVLVGHDPTDHCLLFLLGDSMYSLGHLGEAIGYYKRSIELKPDFGNAYYKLGVCHYRAGQLEKGRQAFRRVLELGNESHAMANYFLGLINHLLGNDTEALEGFSKLRGVSPESLISNFYLAQLKMKQRKYGEALHLLQELSSSAPNVAEVHYLLGTVQLRLHKTSEAIKSYRRTLELNPQDVRARSVFELLIDG